MEQPDAPATSSHSNSSEPFTKVRNIYMRMGDYEKSKFLTSRLYIHKSAVIPRLTKIIRSGITFVSRNLR